MLIYNQNNRYTYGAWGKINIWKQLNLLYIMINAYGDQDFSDVFADDLFDVSLHYLPETESFHRRKIVSVEITTTAIARNKHYPGLYKKSMSYHKSFKHLRLDISTCNQIFEQDMILSKFINIKYIPIKIGMVKLNRFKQLYMEDDEE